MEEGYGYTRKERPEDHPNLKKSLLEDTPGIYVEQGGKRLPGDSGDSSYSFPEGEDKRND